MKKFKNLMFFLILILFFTIIILSNKSLATDTISDNFKQILNEEGKLVVTDTSMAKDEISFLNMYLQRYRSNNNGYYFEVTKKIDETHYNITLNGDESHTVEIVYEEKFSDEFKQILNKDGKFVIKSSSKNLTKDYIGSYLNNKTNFKFRFITENIDEEPYYKYLINDDLSKGTIAIFDNNRIPIEFHTIEFAYETKKSEEFKKFVNLNKDEKLVINSVKPTNQDEFTSLMELLVVKDGMSYFNNSNDFSSCDIAYKDEIHTIQIVYNYDNSIRDKLTSLTKNFPQNIEFFKVQDMELINYWVNNGEKSDTLAYYSGELKSYLNNYNVSIYIDNRAGDGSIIYTERQGIFLIKYDDIVYYVSIRIGANGDHIIYVPNSTGDSREELIAAVQKRIDDYIGKNKVTVTYSGTAYDIWLKDQYESTRHSWQQINPNMTFEEWKNLGYSKYDGKFEDVVHVKGVTEEDPIFSIKVENKNYYFLIRKDDSKMVNTSLVTSDMLTNVEINTDNTSVALDTSIQAKKLTSGDEYNKIIKLLNIEENLMYDLKLYSMSSDKYITKLDNGTFEVKIPIIDTLKGKDLVAYYIDENNKIIEYDVTVKDGYAIFKTNHFSIYTLAAKTSNPTSTTPLEKDNVPKTGTTDIINYILIATLVSGIGIVILKKH